MKFVPNALTIARIVLTPVLLLMLLSETLLGHVGALALFVLAAISDYFDGKIARDYEVRSRLGQFLDPLADKILVLGTFAVLSFMLPDIVPWWAVVLIALRDLAVTLLRTWTESRGRTLRTLGIAKWKTTLQLAFLIGLLTVLVARQPEMPQQIAAAAIWLLDSLIPFIVLMGVVALTVFTGVWYFFNQETVSPA
ncbi:MAG: CDP-diacylglycerol--glycerol-3-phosphate 3-phosphatidyltransferase [Bacteroidetes bacterium]|nr:CDP-diacylglycerol--glycerol-3-phosphate 3-phosphatidyltransferase [Bacteroidota bacterium]